MPDLNVIKFDINGHPRTGLVEWEAIAPEIIVSGNPVQRGHTYFSTEADKFSAGVWDCTEHELQFSAYEVDEFIHVLEGSITLIDKSGENHVYRAGESFIIPRGCECSWTQSQYCRKYWVILDDAENESGENSGFNAIRINTDSKFPAVPQTDPSPYLSDIPEMGLLSLYKDQSGKFEVGLWECSPMQRVPATLARSELMIILEGSGSITNADGVIFNFKAGDTLLVPVGMGYQWHSTEYVKKVFCSYAP